MYGFFHQNSVPQIPGMGDVPSISPGASGQFPQSKGFGLPAVPGVPAQQFGVPSQTLPSGMEGPQSGKLPGMADASSVYPGSLGQFPGVPQPTQMGLPALHGVPSEQLASFGGTTAQALPLGMKGPSGQIPEMGDASSAFPGAGGQLPGIPQPTGMGLPSVPGVSTEQLPSGGLGDGGSSFSPIPGVGTIPQGGPGQVPGSLPFTGLPTDVASAGGMVPVPSGLTVPGTPSVAEEGYGAMLPASQINSGVVPQGGLLPSPTVMPAGAQYGGDSMPPYARAVDEIGAEQLQGMGLPPNMPNPDLLVSCEPT